MQSGGGAGGCGSETRKLFNLTETLYKKDLSLGWPLDLILIRIFYPQSSFWCHSRTYIPR